MNFLKAGILKTILILLLIIGGGIFIISLPKIFGTMLVNTIDWLTGGTEPKYDESGKMIYDDGRKTIESFGTRKEFAILKFSLEKDKQTVFKKARWSLYERDNNKSIEKDVNDYKKISPFVYVVGFEKGYTRLDYETGEVIQSEDIDSFGEEDRKIFGSLKAGKGFIKKQLCAIYFSCRKWQKQVVSRGVSK